MLRWFVAITPLAGAIAFPILVPITMAKVGIGAGVGPVISRADLELASHYWYASSAKAAAELSFVPRDPLVTLEDTLGDILDRQGRAFARFR